jgi:putative acyl-CoA dehydrogenase
MRLCRSFDRSASDPREAVRARLLTPVVKYWVCKSAPGFSYEAMECLGGNGYVEDGPLARIYREAPVNAIWEGSGNVMCLDLLRALSREPEAEAVLADLSGRAGEFPGGSETARFVATSLSAAPQEARARAVVEALASLAATDALAQSAPPSVAECFARTRLASRPGRLYGAVELTQAEQERLLQRALPA